MKRSSGGRVQIVAGIAAVLWALGVASTLASSTVIVDDGPASSGSLAPDMSQVKIDSSDDGSFGAEIQVDKVMEFLDQDNEEIGAVTTYLDLDGNPATTGPQEGLAPGAETSFTIFNEGFNIRGAIDGIALLDSASSSASGTRIWWKTTNLRHLGISPGTTIGIRLESSFGDQPTRDYLPDRGPGGIPTWIRYQVAAPEVAPAPAPVTAPIVAPVPTPRAARPLVVAPLRLKSLTRGRVQATFGWARATGTVRWKLRLTALVGGTRQTRVLSGTSTQRARSASRVVTLRLPPGTRISGRLELTHSKRVYGRSSSTRT